MASVGAFFLKQRLGFDPRWAAGSKRRNIFEVGTADPGGLLVGALLVDDGMFMGERKGKHPCPARGQTRASHMLMPVVLLFSLVVSCSPSQAPACCSHHTSPSPGCSHWLGAPSFALLGRVPAGAGASGTIRPSHHPGWWPSTCPASLPPDLGLPLCVPHPQSFIPCSGSASALSTSPEERRR